MKTFWLVMIAAAGLFSCGSGDTQQDDDFDFDFDTFYAEFQNEKAAWEGLNIDHYRFAGETLSHAFSQWNNIAITVFPDKEPEVMLIHGLNEEPCNYIYPFNPFQGKTITEIYACIDGWLHYWEPPKCYKVSYNKEYHYPESVYIGTKLPPNTSVGGGETGLDIYSFQDLRGQ
jgi:hypothetical protein